MPHAGCSQITVRFAIADWQDYCMNCGGLWPTDANPAGMKREKLYFAV
jgi:hypothetical protein